MANTRVTNPVTDFDKTNTTQGLKLPSGINSNQPNGVDAIQGMLRNDNGQTVGSSASSLTHYNGTEWRYFAATESPDVIYPTSLKIYLDANNTNSYPGTGTTWFDLTSNANNGAISGATWNSDGYFDFDGSNDYVNIDATANSPVNFSEKNYTISCWINPDNVNSNNPIFTKYGLDDSLRSIFFNIHTDGTLRFLQRATGTTDQQFSSSTISVGVWTNVTIVRDSSTVKFYINGAIDASRSTTFTPNTGGNQNITIGSQADGAFNFFDGKISYVKLFNEVLTASEVTVLYEQGR